MVSEPWRFAGDNDTEPRMMRCISNILCPVLVTHKSMPSPRGHRQMLLFFTWLVARKSSPSQRGHQRCLPIIREPVMWNARQSLYRPWDACLPYVWPSRLRSGQPMLSLCRRIPGRRRLFLCASRIALCQPMSDVSLPIARPNAVRRSRFQGCSHAIGRS